MYKGKNPDMDNYKKLLHIMQYLRATKDLILMIEPGNHPNWWVDISYAEHLDMHSHSGIYMTLGKGVTLQQIYKAETQYQKLYGSGTCGHQ